MNHRRITLLGPFLMGGMGGALALGLAESMTTPPVLPIAILDRGHLLKRLEEGSPDNDRDTQIRHFETAAKQLAHAGYLVIDRGWVIAAPEDFYVDLPE